MSDGGQSLNHLLNSIDIENRNMNSTGFEQSSMSENTTNVNPAHNNQSDNGFSNEQVIPNVDLFSSFLNPSLISSDQTSKLTHHIQTTM